MQFSLICHSIKQNRLICNGYVSPQANKTKQVLCKYVIIQRLEIRVAAQTLKLKPEYSVSLQPWRKPDICPNCVLKKGRL